ncbi:hypothetical protein [Streptomyces buecherae]|nr:hypothetical protein [Streptomyces buecherae]
MSKRLSSCTQTRKLARTTATGELRLSHLKLEQRQIRGGVLDAIE